MATTNDTLYTNVLRTLVSQNDIVDITPLVTSAALPDGHADIKAMVMRLEPEKFQILMCRIKAMDAKKHARLLASAKICYEKLLREMDGDDIKTLLNDKAKPMVKDLRATFVLAMSMGVSESECSGWVFDSIADGLAKTGFPKEIVTETISWICGQVLAGPPPFTGSEIRANIQEKIATATSELVAEEEAYANIRELCDMGFKKGLTLESLWETTLRESAEDLREMYKFIDRAERRELRLEEYRNFPTSTMLTSACLYEVMKRCWPSPPTPD